MACSGEDAKLPLCSFKEDQIPERREPAMTDMRRKASRKVNDILAFRNLKIGCRKRSRGTVGEERDVGLLDNPE